MQGRSGKRGALLTFAILLTVSSGTAYAADPIEIKENDATGQDGYVLWLAVMKQSPLR